MSIGKYTFFAFGIGSCSGTWTGAMYDAMGSDGSRGDMFPMAALLKAKQGGTL